ncbi:MAG: membrane protein insertase YidC [Formosimonas sp.]
MKNFSSRTILWLIFAMSSLFLWSSWQAEHAPIETAQVAQSEQKTADNAAVTPVSTQSVAPKGDVITLENDVLRLKINTEGGVVQFAELLQYKNSHDGKSNVLLLNSDAQNLYLARSGLANKELGLNHKTTFTSTAPSAVLTQGQDSVSVTLSAQNNGVTLRKVYTLKRGSYSVDVSHEVDNASSAAIAPNVYLEIARDASQIGDSVFYSTFTGPVIYNEDNKFKKITFEDIAKDGAKGQFTEKADNGWVGLVQHYFVSAWVVNDKMERQFYTNTVQTAPVAAYSVGEILSLGSVEPAAKKQISAQFYVGPQDQDTLATVAKGLDLSVDYGWLTMISKPLYALLAFLQSFISNWGWTIIAMTLLVKLVLFPLNAASFKSMAKMKVLAPRLKALQEQYGDDKMKLNQAMMALYKEEKVNPAGGCLPMLAQMPIFIGFYYVLQAAVEMRGAPWVGWIKDLSTPDPYYILPVLMIVTMLIQTKLNPKPADPLQAKMMTWMPLMFGFTFLFFPSGLVLYWVVSNIFSIVQQQYMNKKFGINESLISLKSE